VKQRIAVVFSLAGLCGLAAGYVSDARTQPGEQIACQIRYQGGPKSDATRTTTNCTSSGKTS
jgi:hypothetical protein